MWTREYRNEVYEKLKAFGIDDKTAQTKTLDLERWQQKELEASIKRLSDSLSNKR